eukprot:m.311266 g.311266  ORF g.311266 m.311266 type:complete len:69 (+) comp63706_c0_seq1:102-308(+)
MARQHRLNHPAAGWTSRRTVGLNPTNQTKCSGACPGRLDGNPSLEITYEDLHESPFPASFQNCTGIGG